MKGITLINSKNKKIRLSVEIADSFFRRALGLMFRPALGKSSGMLFIFDKEDYYSLWMLFTSIPLEALFISGKGKIADIIELNPHDLTSKSSYKKARYILEVARGFSSRNRIKIGNRVGIDKILC